MPWSMEAIKRANERAGGNFFHPDSISHYRSKIFPEVYEGDGGTWFVTSEKDGLNPREYSARQFDAKTGKITNTVGPCENKWEAVALARAAAMGTLTL